MLPLGSCATSDLQIQLSPTYLLVDGWPTPQALLQTEEAALAQQAAAGHVDGDSTLTLPDLLDAKVRPEGANARLPSRSFMIASCALSTFPHGQPRVLALATHERASTRSDGGCRAALEQIDAVHGAIEEWRRYEPDVDLSVSPCCAVELPDPEVDELHERLLFTPLLRRINHTGWACLAIANMQLIAPCDEVVLAVGLAWERW